MQNFKEIIGKIIPNSLSRIIRELRLQSGFRYKALLSGSPHLDCQYVTYYCDAGMANRIRSHLTAAVLAKRTHRNMAVYWPENKVCGATFQDLFEWSGQPIKRLKRLRTIHFPGIFEPAENLLTKIPESQAIVLAFEWQWITRDQFLHFVGSDADYARSLLCPTVEIKEKVSEVFSSWPEKICGVHVRRGDFGMYGWTIDTQRYITQMEEMQRKLGNDLHFFLCSDGSEQELQPIMEKFKGLIHRRTKSSRETSSGIKDALIDFLLLSKTKHLVLTQRSSFGEMAAFIGNVPYVYA